MGKLLTTFSTFNMGWLIADHCPKEKSSGPGEAGILPEPQVPDLEFAADNDPEPANNDRQNGRCAAGFAGLGPYRVWFLIFATFCRTQSGESSPKDP